MPELKHAAALTKPEPAYRDFGTHPRHDTHAGGIFERMLEDRRPGTQFTCFTSTKVQILTLEELRARQADARLPQFTCFTGTKVPILTPEEPGRQRAVGCDWWTV